MENTPVLFKSISALVLRASLSLFTLISGITNSPVYGLIYSACFAREGVLLSILFNDERE